MNNWTDKKKDKAVELYEKAKPTPETTFKIVKEIAEELDVSPNGLRMILTKAGVYIRKDHSTEYQNFETASLNNTYYRDVDFRGTVRLFGTADAWCDEYEEKALLGEDFDAFQVRMILQDKLDMDLYGKEDYRRPWYRPFNIQTREVS